MLYTRLFILLLFTTFAPGYTAQNDETGGFLSSFFSPFRGFITGFANTAANAITAVINPFEKAAIWGIQITGKAANLTGQALVLYVNAVQQFFTTTLNTRFSGMDDATKKNLINGIVFSMTDMAAEVDKAGRVTHNLTAKDIPESFDARTAWPQCSSIGVITDQSTCSSCWAVVAAAVISDRICIASGGKQQISISADDILSCCGPACGAGCDGGSPLQAFDYWVAKGVVTGSPYGAQTGCLPYPFPPCDGNTTTNAHYAQCNSLPVATTPVCTKASRTCQSGYSMTYSQDKHFGKSVYGVNKNVLDIQAEIMLNGPVEASFEIYDDFVQYSSGIYVHHAGADQGVHAVRVIGWGVDGTTPYWLCANSWNTDWGENGFFRIIRGSDECSFEDAIVAGLPR